MLVLALQSLTPKGLAMSLSGGIGNFQQTGSSTGSQSNIDKQPLGHGMLPNKNAFIQMSLTNLFLFRYPK